MIHAIKNKLQIRFNYEKYLEDTITSRVVETYCSKEFKNRWYLVAKDIKGSNPKTFALDRMTDLEITSTKFIVPASFDIHELFKHCYGIITPTNQQPEEVILSFDPDQGKYIKSLPLHKTQKILIDNDDELRIKLTVYMTHDFIMELFSYSNNVKVLQPVSLVKKMKEEYEKALKRY